MNASRRWFWAHQADPTSVEAVKIRIGYGLGTASTTTDRVRFGALVDNLETLGFDSLWLSERVNGPALDPVVGMTFATARTTRLKVGASVMVLPGRNPVLLAKTMASLDQLSNGRLLPAFGLGVANAAEHQAFGVDRKERAASSATPLDRRRSHAPWRALPRRRCAGEPQASPRAARSLDGWRSTVRTSPSRSLQRCLVAELLHRRRRP